MQQNRLTGISRVLLGLGSLLLVLVLFVPMWRIDLDAPQYPEGLRLLIYPHKLGGNVEIINGLNHYIGMKTLHTEDFFEFVVLPYIIIFFAIIILASALAGRKKLLYAVFTLFVMFGVLAMYDFWRWEYNYGHNLDPNAAIIVPGMAYQPPLIGFKQLLNFGAYSIPDIGGWLFIGTGLILLSVVLYEWKRSRSVARNTRFIIAYSGILFLVQLTSCSSGPEPIKAGVDQCHFCKMTITDLRFAAELVTKKGKVYKYDDIHCLQAFMKSGYLDPEDVREQYASDYCGTHALLPIRQLFFLSGEELHSPMGGNIAAFSIRDSMLLIREKLHGEEHKPSDILLMQ